MPAKAAKSWIDSYQPGIEKHYDKMMQGIPDKIEDFWKKWVNDNAQGLEALAPYGSKATPLADDFSLSLPPSGTPVVIAQLMATAWKGWVEKIVWPPPPPAPPFSVVLSVKASSLGVAIAYAGLFSGLIAEMAIIPPDPASAFKLKATSMGTLFYTATVSAGVQIDGLSLSAPPVPVSLPLLPTI